MTVRKIGVEVELAVYKLRSPIVCSFLRHTKNNPLNIRGTLYHKDASMFEIAIAPAESPEEYDDLSYEAIDTALCMLPYGTHMAAHPSVDYDQEELDLDEYASVLGCSESRNIYGRKPATPAQYPDNTRYGGMHVNIEQDRKSKPADALRLDATLGLMSVAFCEGGWADGIRKRRSMYGMAGEYRMKDFGIEYRTLPSSTFDLLDGNKLFEVVDYALNMPLTDLKPHAMAIQEAINNVDVEQATSLLSTLHEDDAPCRTL